MTIKFRTKEESNREQEKEFLALSPQERILRLTDKYGVRLLMVGGG